MAYEVKILADSTTPSGKRLTTFELTYPRFIHSEFMTHRQFSRNAASSRAVPIEKMIQRVMDDPFIPIYWGANQKGMVAGDEVGLANITNARHEWLCARDSAVQAARRLHTLGLHKQVANRLLEPFMWMTTICSATEWGNFFALRCAPDAQPEFQKLARLMYQEHRRHEPTFLRADEWHLPLVNDEDRRQFGTCDLCRLAVARCARVSYHTHDGRRDPQADFDLHDRLAESGHMSPFEHVARPFFYHQIDPDSPESQGNFVGWVQYRKQFANECRPYPAEMERAADNSR